MCPGELELCQWEICATAAAVRLPRDKHVVDLMLVAHVQAYSFEAGNARHEDQWMIWQDVKLLEGKILIRHELASP